MYHYFLKRTVGVNFGRTLRTALSRPDDQCDAYNTQKTEECVLEFAEKASGKKVRFNLYSYPTNRIWCNFVCIRGSYFKKNTGGNTYQFPLSFRRVAQNYPICKFFFLRANYGDNYTRNFFLIIFQNADSFLGISDS